MKNFRIIVWCPSISESIIMKNYYINDGWKIKDDITLRWNWSGFRFMYRFEVNK